jgi:hypothetical protein
MAVSVPADVWPFCVEFHPCSVRTKLPLLESLELDVAGLR